MSDPIQSSSSVPLPAYQTLQGTRDPLPMTAPAEIEQTADEQADARRDEETDAFKSYLDRTSVTLIEKRAHRLDAADLIGRDSPYLQPGVTLAL